MLPIVWTEDAANDLAQIIDYIAEQNLAAAFKLGKRIRESVLPLAHFPYLFRESERMPGYREIVAHPNYIIFYRILPDRVQVEMVAHGKRKFPISR